MVGPVSPDSISFHPGYACCRSGARSAQACAFMASKGYGNMHNLSGGIMAWARSGNALSQPR
ncbi:MAG: rhodanese-like domain-containing protein [Gammaproteobacteria bacterium]